MFRTTLAATAVVALAHAQQDTGIFVGGQQGLLMCNEEADIINLGCSLPEMDPMFVQAEAMIPMAKMMATNMN